MARTGLKRKFKEPFTDAEWKIALKQNLCPYGCVLETKDMCEHLERLMPKFSGESVKAILTEDVDRFSGLYADNARDAINEEEFRDELGQLDLEPARIEMLVLRIVYKHSFSRIAEVLGFKNGDQVNYLFNRTVVKVVEKKSKK